MIFGGYLIFWFALKFRALHLSAVAGRNDVSYGVLPLRLADSEPDSLERWTINPILLCIATLACAGIARIHSWHLLEKHAIAVAHRTIKPSAVVA